VFTTQSLLESGKQHTTPRISLLACLGMDGGAHYMNATRAEMEDIARVLYTRLYSFWRYKKLLPPELAEDLAQAGVLVALQRVDKWGGKASLLTFLTSVARNAGIDELRKERRQGRILEAVRRACELLRLPGSRPHMVDRNGNQPTRSP
jgi:DNA-directed RNA polymerase specialized sigma24 family protein